MASRLPNGDHGRGFDNPPDSPYIGSMEALADRVTTLERDAREIKSILGRLEPAINRLMVDVAEMKGRISHMPTLLGIGGTMLAINAGIVGLAALIIALLR